jgi:transcriptional regulator with XRE-family HTH domain
MEEFILEDYVVNPLALARIKANLTQEQLAEKMGVTHTYISKLESQEHVSGKILLKVMNAIQEE